MKRSKFTEEQIAFALHQADTGVSELRRLRQLEEENPKLKQLVADLSLDKVMLQDVLRKKL
jgi:putative transposase